MGARAARDGDRGAQETHARLTSMGRWDVEVLGLDRGKTSSSIAGDIARKLGADVAHVERILAHVPATLVADLDEDAAKQLVVELRAIGVRVKPRPAAIEPARVADERATGPTLALPTVEPRVAESRAGSPLEHLSTGALAKPSGLELEDVAPRVRASAPAPAIVSAPVVLDHDDDHEASPRVFWSALPSAFLVPLRAPVLPGLIAAPIFMALAVLFTVLGTFTAIVGTLVLAAAFVGTTLQVSHRCLWATAVGERMPASLPSGFMAEYAFPGLGIVVMQAMIGGVVGWAGMRALSYGVPMIAIQLAMVLYALYAVIGFALAAASRSPLAFLDVVRIVRILVSAPAEVIVISIVGAIVQGGAVAIAVGQFAAAAEMGGIGLALLAALGSTLVVSFAASYGTAVTATMMGMLFWARPAVAG